MKLKEIMERITAKELVEFRKRTNLTKKNFGFKLKTRPPKIKSEKAVSGGGHYWVFSTSSIHNGVKYKNKELLIPKIEELQLKLENSTIRNSKNMYQRNLDILVRFMDLDIDSIVPNEFKLLPIQNTQRILRFSNIPVFVSPNFIYSFSKNEEKNRLGALWIVPKLNGYNREELGVFCEILYRYLIENYSKEFIVDKESCKVLDTYSGRIISYLDLENGEIPFLLDATINELIKI